MEGDQAERHRCKVCRKSFPSGRSLGGHMRSHVHTAAVGSSETDAEEKPTTGIRGAGYGLRENPKKTWRLSDYTGDDGEKQCRECGKVFSSWKALFGHMKCHPERICPASSEQEEQQEGSWSNGGQSESEAAAAAVPRRRRGSRRMAAAIAASSSSASEHEKEEEDGAISLMMLSRDVWYSVGGSGGGVLSVAESSDKNSVVFEGKGIGEGNGDFVSRNGYWRNGLKRVESDASDDRFVRDRELKKPKVCNSDADKIENSSDEVLRKDSSKEKDFNSAVVTELGLKPRLDGSEFEVKKERFEVSDATKFGRDYVERFRFDASDGGFDKAPERRSRFECTTCKKTFHSYQALGGHRASHKRMKGCCGSENRLETDASVEQAAVEEMVDRGVGVQATSGLSKKAKGHECRLCGKVFASGQALGGHKRSHLVANSDDRGDAAASHQPLVIQQQDLEMPDLLDLNLPARIDGESNNTNVNAELNSWWAASNLKHEPLVGVISN